MYNGKELFSKLEKIEKGIRDYAESNGLNGVVVGLSGGIDSSLVATLSAKALGSDRVLGIILPSKHTSKEDIKDAVSLAEGLGIEYKKEHIQPFVDSMLNGENDAMVAGNLTARVRMVILYFNANKLGRIVIGTDNRSELMTGYFTKYGDGGVDLLPIADLYKTEIFRAAKLLDLPESIIAKKPSAGLWSNQTDETEMGISYKDLDNILYALDKGVNVEGNDVDRVRGMIKATEHKRRMPPVIQVR